jgi:hypothetical protein
MNNIAGSDFLQSTREQELTGNQENCRGNSRCSRSKRPPAVAEEQPTPGLE